MGLIWYHFGDKIVTLDNCLNSSHRHAFLGLLWGQIGDKLVTFIYEWQWSDMSRLFWWQMGDIVLYKSDIMVTWGLPLTFV